MPPLSHFAVDDSSKALVAALADLKVPIRTAEMLLSRDTSYLANELRLPAHALDSFRQLVARHCAPSRLRNIDGSLAAQIAVGGRSSISAQWPFDSVGTLSSIYAGLSLNLSTGSEALDKVLDNGLQLTDITEVIGRSGCGKTQLCLTAAVLAALQGHTVVYLDVGNCFSARRCLDIARCRANSNSTHLKSSDSLQAPTTPSPGELQGAMSRIHVIPVFDIFDALDNLERITCSLGSKQHGDAIESENEINDRNLEEGDTCSEPGPSLLILDSVTALVAPILGGDARQLGGFSGQAMLGHLVASLRRLASVHAVGVLITNEARDSRGSVNHGIESNTSKTHIGSAHGSSTTSTMKGSENAALEIKPALGQSWTSVASVRVVLSENLATVTKHSRLEAGASARVSIGRGGFI